MNPKKVLCLPVSLVTLLALSLVWFSCSGSGSSNKEDGVVTIRYMRWGVMEELEAEKELLQLFEQENPDIQVKLEVSTWNEYWRKLQGMFSSRSAPDVFLMGGEYLRDYVDKNVLQSLDEKVEAENFDLSLYFSTPINIFTYKDQLWGLPRDCNTVVIYYNKDMFAEEGVPEPSDDWTWEEFLVAARKLSKDLDGDGAVDQWGYMVGNDSAEVRFAHWIWQNGGQILNEDKTACLFGEPESIEAIQFMHDMIHKYEVAPPLPKLSSFGGSYFTAGQMAMINEGSWMLRFNRKIEKFDWDVAPLPKGKVKAAPVNGLANVMYKGTENPEAAWRLIKFLSGRKYQEALAESGTSIPALKEVAYSDFFLNAHPKPERIKILLDQLEYAQPIDFTQHYSRWDLEIRKQLELAFLDRKPVAEACRDAAKKVNEILADIKKDKTDR